MREIFMLMNILYFIVLYKINILIYLYEFWLANNHNAMYIWLLAGILGLSGPGTPFNES